MFYWHIQPVIVIGQDFNSNIIKGGARIVSKMKSIYRNIFYFPFYQNDK